MACCRSRARFADAGRCRGLVHRFFPASSAVPDRRQPNDDRAPNVTVTSTSRRSAVTGSIAAARRQDWLRRARRHARPHGRREPRLHFARTWTASSPSTPSCASPSRRASREAARQMRVSRSVVTARIQQLEDFVGAPLFHRNTRSVRLLGARARPSCATAPSWSGRTNEVRRPDARGHDLAGRAAARPRAAGVRARASGARCCRSSRRAIRRSCST